MKRAVDLIVIGGGSGGLQAGYDAAVTYKRKVIVIDTQRYHGPPNYAALGGTCVNVGCVPKKLMVIGAHYRDALHDAEGFGHKVTVHPSDWTKLMENKNKAVRDINDSYAEMFRDVDGLDFVEGWGSFEDAHTVLVRKGSSNDSELVATLTAPHVLVATGSWPFTPPMPGSELTISSNEAFYLKECPRRPLIVGGGFIAVEFAGIFNAYKAEGGEVTVAYRGDLFLRGFDSTIREELAKQMKATGITLKFKDTPTKVELASDGKTRRVTFSSGEVGEYDCVMMATGRNPRTETLNLAKAGIKMGAKNCIAVDEYSRSNVEGVYAIGDVTGRVMLTPVAIEEGACAVSTMYGTARKTDHSNIPGAVFSIPPIGTVGMLEEDAAKKFDTVAVYQGSSLPLTHRLTGRSYRRVFVRTVVDHSTGRVLGVHLLGGEGPEVIQAVGIAIKMNATVKDFFGTMCVHPTSAEDLCSEREPDYYYVKGVKKVKL